MAFTFDEKMIIPITLLSVATVCLGFVSILTFIPHTEHYQQFSERWLFMSIFLLLASILWAQTKALSKEKGKILSLAVLGGIIGMLSIVSVLSMNEETREARDIAWVTLSVIGFITVTYKKLKNRSNQTSLTTPEAAPPTS